MIAGHIRDCRSNASANRRGNHSLDNRADRSLAIGGGFLCELLEQLIAIEVAGKKSQTACQPGASGLAVMARLTSMATGPEMPKCVNKNEPRRSATGFIDSRLKISNPHVGNRHATEFMNPRCWRTQWHKSRSRRHDRMPQPLSPRDSHLRLCRTRDTIARRYVRITFSCQAIPCDRLALAKSVFTYDAMSTTAASSRSSARLRDRAFARAHRGHRSPDRSREILCRWTRLWWRLPRR